MTLSTKSNWLTSVFFPLLLTLLVAACGGGGISIGPNPPPELSNVVTIGVDNGGAFFNASPNTLYVNITLCGPNDTCMTIPNVLVDTASIGLRLFAHPLNTAGPLSVLNLEQQTDNAGNPIAECLPFGQGVTWGPVQFATLQMNGKTASNLPIQVIADPGFTDVPVECTNKGPLMNDPAALGVNGILGIGLFRQDCGANCTSSNPARNIYFNCDAFGQNCINTAQSLVNQVQNPVTYFSSDNNGFIITLNSVASSGAPFVNGTLTFGIDTQSNNASQNAHTILVDNSPNSPTYGYFTTTLNGTTFTKSFFDTGSNGYFFNLPGFNKTCVNGFYCPDNTTPFAATISGITGSTAPANVNFNIANAATLFSNQNNVAFNDLGGTGTALFFDWGIPFFFGRSVYFVIDGGATNRGNGPYVGW